MSEVDIDPFDESSWGNLRYAHEVSKLIEAAKNAMAELANCFEVESQNSPRLEFKAGGEMPSIGRFVTPLGSAELRLSFEFRKAREANEPDDIACAVRVFVQDAGLNERKLRVVDWRLDVPQYGAVVAHCGSKHCVISSDTFGTQRLKRNRYQAGMALYRAIAEQL